MWDTIDELWIQARIATSFWYEILCVLTLITQQLQVAYGCSTYWMTTLLLEMSIFCVRAGCKIQLMSYGSKHALQCLSDKQIVHTWTHNMKTAGHIMDVPFIKRMLYYQRHSLCALELHERSYWRAMAPDTHQSFSDTTLCAYTASPHIHMYIAIWCATTHDNRTHVPYDCILHTKWRLYCQQHIIL